MVGLALCSRSYQEVILLAKRFKYCNVKNIEVGLPVTRYKNAVVCVCTTLDLWIRMVQSLHVTGYPPEFLLSTLIGAVSLVI